MVQPWAVLDLSLTALILLLQLRGARAQGRPLPFLPRWMRLAGPEPGRAGGSQQEPLTRSPQSREGRTGLGHRRSCCGLPAAHPISRSLGGGEPTAIIFQGWEGPGMRRGLPHPGLPDPSGRVEVDDTCQPLTTAQSPLLRFLHRAPGATSPQGCSRPHGPTPEASPAPERSLIPPPAPPLSRALLSA